MCGDIDAARCTELLNYLGNPSAPAVPSEMEVDSDEPAVPTPAAAPAVAAKKGTEDEPLAKLPEGEVYVSLLIVLWLLDNGHFAKVRTVLRCVGHGLMVSCTPGKGAGDLVDCQDDRAEPEDDGPARVQALLLLGPPARAER